MKKYVASRYAYIHLFERSKLGDASSRSDLETQSSLSTTTTNQQLPDAGNLSFHELTDMLLMQLFDSRFPGEIISTQIQWSQEKGMH